MTTVQRRARAFSTLIFVLVSACGGSELAAVSPPPRPDPAAEKPKANEMPFAPDAATQAADPQSAAAQAQPPPIDESQPTVSVVTPWSGPTKLSELRCPAGATLRTTKKDGEVPKAIQSFHKEPRLQTFSWCETKDHGLQGPWLMLSTDNRLSWGAFDHGIMLGRQMFGMPDGTRVGIEFKFGVPHGDVIVTNGSTVDTIGHVEFGEDHGSKYSFHPNGKVAEESHYHHGIKHGVVRGWDEAGKLTLWADYRSGEVCRAFLRKGERMEVSKSTKPCAPESDPPKGKWESMLSDDFPATTKSHAKSCDDGGFESCVPFVNDLAAFKTWQLPAKFTNDVRNLLAQMCRSGTRVAASACLAASATMNQRTCFLWGYDTACLGTGRVGKAECAPRPSVCKNASPGETCLVGTACTPANWGECDCP